MADLYPGPLTDDEEEIPVRPNSMANLDAMSGVVPVNTSAPLGSSRAIAPQPVAPEMPQGGSDYPAVSMPSAPLGPPAPDSTLGPAAQRLKTLTDQGAPPVTPLHGGKRVLDTLGQIFVPNVERSLRYGAQRQYGTNLQNAQRDYTLETDQREMPLKENELQTQNDLRTAQANEANTRTDVLKNPQVKPTKGALVFDKAGNAVGYQNEDGDLMAPDNPKLPPDVAKILGAAKAKQTPEKLEHVEVEDPANPGKPVMANYDAAKGAYLDQSGKPIPNARPFEKPTAEPGNYLPVPDPQDPLHKIIGWVDPKSGHFRSLQDIHMGGTGGGAVPGVGTVKPTGQEASREGQADVVQKAGNGLIADVQAKKSKMGNMDAIVRSAFLGTPLADPDQAGLATEIASFAALQPAMHGFRGTDALEQFKKLLGGIPNNPDALISSIKAMQKTAGYFDPNNGNAAHSFTYNGKKYSGVPDDVYSKYKSKPGFKE